MYFESTNILASDLKKKQILVTFASKKEEPVKKQEHFETLSTVAVFSFLLDLQLHVLLDIEL